MSTFKQFIENDIRGFGSNNLGRGKRTVQDGEPYVGTGDLTGWRDELMSPKRRQMIDIDEPGQKYYYFITLTRALIADVDTGKLIAGHKNDTYSVVYTPDEITKIGYADEEQKYIKELGIFIDTDGYDHRELVRIIGTNNLDEIKKFRHGILFDPEKYLKFRKKIGLFVDYEKLSEVRDELDKWLRIQGTIERGKQHITSPLMQIIKQGAAKNNLPPSPTVTYS